MSLFGILVYLVDSFTYSLATFAICNFLSLKMSTGVRWWDKGGGEGSLSWDNVQPPTQTPPPHPDWSKFTQISDQNTKFIQISDQIISTRGIWATFAKEEKSQYSPCSTFAWANFEQEVPLKSPKWEWCFITQQKIEWSNQVELVTCNRGKAWNLIF